MFHQNSGDSRDFVPWADALKRIEWAVLLLLDVDEVEVAGHHDDSKSLWCIEGFKQSIGSSWAGVKKNILNS